MKTWNIIVYCFAVGAFAGCEHEVAPDPLPVREHPLYFTAGIAGAASAGITTRADDPDTDTITPKLVAARDSLLKKTFTEGDVIRICNTNTDKEEPSFNIEGSSSVYQYVWKKYKNESGFPEGSDEEDKWLDEGPNDSRSEYLFVPDSIPSTDVKYGFYASDLISDGANYFQLYAAWWKEFEPGVRDNAPVIERDQSTKDGFLNSDMMLAYRKHSIDYPYAAMRLVFWHVFSMLDVRITLPDYDKGHVNAGEGDAIPDRLPSGYEKDSVKLFMTNVPVDYSITHTADYSSGNLLSVLPNTSERAEAIPMYRYYTSGPFLKDVQVDEGKMKKDSCRTYGFCGIVPPMEWTADQEVQPLLRLKLKDPLSRADRYYTYTPTKINDSEYSLTLQGGHISVLEFDLSRNADDMEVVRATIQPWTEAETDVPVTEMGK